MEMLIGAAAGIGVVFLCVFCFFKGVGVGRAVRDDKPIEKPFEKPKRQKIPKDGKDEGRMDLAAQLEELTNFQAQHTEDYNGQK